jgi:hypothetical protein
MAQPCTARLRSWLPAQQFIMPNKLIHPKINPVSFFMSTNTAGSRRRAGRRRAPFTSQQSITQLIATASARSSKSPHPSFIPSVILCTGTLLLVDGSAQSSTGDDPDLAGKCLLPSRDDPPKLLTSSGAVHPRRPRHPDLASVRLESFR